MRGNTTRRVVGPAQHVVIVLGKRDDITNGRRRTSAHMRHRVAAAQSALAEGDVRAVILSGGSSGGASEAHQMATLWPPTSTLLILEENSQNTCENAARCLPLILAMPDVTHVTVVSCNWHVWTRYAFSPYRKYGLRVRYASAKDPHTEAASKLLRQTPRLHRLVGERRRAFAAIKPELEQ